MSDNKHSISIRCTTAKCNFFFIKIISISGNEVELQTRCPYCKKRETRKLKVEKVEQPIK